MSSQLYLIFRSEEDCGAIREKYGWDDIRTELSLTFEDMLSLKENTVLWVTYP